MAWLSKLRAEHAPATRSNFASQDAVERIPINGERLLDRSGLPIARYITAKSPG